MVMGTLVTMKLERMWKFFHRNGVSTVVRTVVGFFHNKFARALRASWLIFGKIKVNLLASLAGSVTRKAQQLRWRFGGAPAPPMVLPCAWGTGCARG